MGASPGSAHSERIRTLVATPFDVIFFDTAALPTYQDIAPKALRLRELKMSHRAIAQHLGVALLTVQRALAWIQKKPIGKVKNEETGEQTSFLL
jgi:hypothetical protein